MSKTNKSRNGNISLACGDSEVNTGRTTQRWKSSLAEGRSGDRRRRWMTFQSFMDFFVFEY